MGLGSPATIAPATRPSRGMPALDADPATSWLAGMTRAATVPGRDTAAELLDMRQLRHQTKNALQRILGVLMAAPQDAGGGCIEDVARRIRLSAEISNALFGLTRAPGPMQARLETLAAAVAALMSAPGQSIGVQVQVDGDCPLALRPTVIQVAHEFIGNALRHGFYDRARGALRIALSSHPGACVRLLVSDDGWGPGADPAPGEGLGIAAALAGHMGGTVTLRRRGVTEAEMLLPPPGGGWSARS